MIGISLPSEFVQQQELRFTRSQCDVCLHASLLSPAVRLFVCQSPKSQPQLNEKQRLQRALNCADCFGVVLDVAVVVVVVGQFELCFALLLQHLDQHSRPNWGSSP